MFHHACFSIFLFVFKILTTEIYFLEKKTHLKFFCSDNVSVALLNDVKRNERK